MNIALAPNSFTPFTGGVSVFTRQLAQAFMARGHRVLVVTSGLAQGHASVEVIDGAEVQRMYFVVPSPLVWRQPEEGLLQFMRHCRGDLRRLRRLLAQRRVEVVNIQSLTGSVFPYLLLGSTDCRLVLTFQGNEFFRLKPGHERVRRSLLRYAIRRADQVVVVSANLAAEVARLWPPAADKTLEIPNGVPVAEFGGPSRPPGSAPYILSLARLNLLKGHDVLLQAFRTVADRVPQVRLLIAGDGPERVRLRAVCLALGLKDRVTFVGEADRTRVRELLAGCELLVLSSWSEGLPIVALEAMASGKAVIGTEVGGIPEIVADGDTGLLVPPGDTDALSKAILRLLDDPEARGAMGRRGLAQVKSRYDFAQTVDRYLEVYGKKLPPAVITA